MQHLRSVSSGSIAALPSSPPISRPNTAALNVNAPAAPPSQIVSSSSFGAIVTTGTDAISTSAASTTGLKLRIPASGTDSAMNQPSAPPSASSGTAQPKVDFTSAKKTPAVANHPFSLSLAGTSSIISHYPATFPDIDDPAYVCTPCFHEPGGFHFCSPKTKEEIKEEDIYRYLRSRFRVLSERIRVDCSLSPTSVAFRSCSVLICTT